MDGNSSSGTVDYRTVDLPPSYRQPRRLKRLLDVLVVMTDVVMLALAFMLGYSARTTVPLFSIPVNPPLFEQYVPTMFLHVVINIGIFYFTRLYHQRRANSRIDEARNLVGAIAVGSLMVNGIQDLVFRNLVYDPIEYPRSMFFYVIVFSIVLVVAGRELNHLLRTQLRRRGFDRANLIIVGMGRVARDISRKVKNSPELGYNIVGVVNMRPKHRDAVFGVPVLGDYHELPTLIDRYDVAQVIIAVPDAQREELVELIALSRRGQVDIKIYPDLFAYMARDMSVDDLGGTPLLTVRDIALRGWKLSLKRAMDILGAGVGLILLSPFMLVSALLIRLESPGPVFYTQERTGMDERPFQMIKFRTMRQDAEQSGPGWTVENDPRVTRIGRFMRRTSWDEITQLINVLLAI